MRILMLGLVGTALTISTDNTDAASSIHTRSNVCTQVYTEANFSGRSYQACGEDATRIPKRLRSLRVPHGTKVRLCQTPGGRSLCRSFYADVSNLGDSFRGSRTDVEVGFFDDEDFEMAIMSDPQFGRSCEPEGGNCEGGARDTAAANAWHGQSIEYLRYAAGYRHFGGVIVNGDITNGHTRGEINAYIDEYEDRSLNIYPGLGNHDVLTNPGPGNVCSGYAVDGINRSGYNAYAAGYCAVRMLDWFVDRINSIPTISRDYVRRSSTEAGIKRRRTTGSLAYSFDIGAYHFVQLNNHPSYHRNISAYVSSKARREHYDVTQSVEWLRADLARSAHKSTVLNLHVMNADAFNGFGTEDCDSDCTAVYHKLARVLDDNPQVVAIFAGHLHNQAGEARPVRLPSGREVPVYLSGSAETNRYLRANFKPESISLDVVDSAYGRSNTAWDEPEVPSVDVPPNPINVDNHDFGTDAGWQANRHPRLLADVNGDGRDDIIGFGHAGVFVSLGWTHGFYRSAKWHVGSTFSYSGGWRTDDHIRTMADVNGDGRADVVGFANSGVYVALSEGASFAPAERWLADFGNDQGWGSRYPRLLGDVDGDGRDDIVGFGYNGVSVALSNGAGFDPLQVWTQGGVFSFGDGWRVDRHPRTLADVNGDGRADIVGFGHDGVWVAPSRGDLFLLPRLWQTKYGYRDGWDGENPRHMADVNGDGMDDVVGFANSGVYVSLSTGDGLQHQTRWNEDFGYDAAWRTARHPRLLADVDGDGRQDVVGFSTRGVRIALSDGNRFSPSHQVTPFYGALAGWTGADHPRLSGDINGDGLADIVGFGREGVYFSRFREGEEGLELF